VRLCPHKRGLVCRFSSASSARSYFTRGHSRRTVDKTAAMQLLWAVLEAYAGGVRCKGGAGRGTQLLYKAAQPQDNR
jgi:hypothetical protein